MASLGQVGGGDAAPGVSGSRAAVAWAARQEAQEAYQAVLVRRSTAERELGQLEQRIREGDADVTFEAVAGLRHKIEVLGHACDREHNRSQVTLDAFHRAEAEDLAAEWDDRAPELRGVIREAIEALVRADKELYGAVAAYNAEAAEAQRQIASRHVPVLSAQPMSPLSFLHLKRLVSPESFREVSMAATLLPPDVVPFELLEQVHGRRVGPVRSPTPDFPSRARDLSEDQQLDAIRAPRSGVQRSPFVRRTPEEA